MPEQIASMNTQGKGTLKKGATDIRIGCESLDAFNPIDVGDHLTIFLRQLEKFHGKTSIYDAVTHRDSPCSFKGSLKVHSL
jgi:hypothetical protein